MNVSLSFLDMSEPFVVILLFKVFFIFSYSFISMFISYFLLFLFIYLLFIIIFFALNNPDNCLLGADWCVRLADFGLSKIKSNSFVRQSVCLTANRDQRRKSWITTTAAMGTPAFTV